MTHLYLTGLFTNGGSLIIMLVLFIAVFYFMVLRPENKKKKEQESLRNSLRVGDKITTIGGIIGEIVNVDGDNIVIETSKDQVRMELTKWAVMTNNTAEKNKDKRMAEAKAEAEKAREEAKKAKEEAKQKKAEEKANKDMR